MKNIFTFVLILATAFTYGQRNWALELGAGLHTVADESADLSGDNFLHLDGVVRYSFNERLGVGLYLGYDNIDLENSVTGEFVNTDYYRASIEAVIDALEVVKLSNDYVTVLAHGGFGYTRFDTDNGFSKYHPNLSGGVTGLVKVTSNFAVKLDWTTTGNFNQKRSLDNGINVTNVGINSFVNNATVGVVFYPGKKKSGEHYDWYNEPEDEELSALKTEVILMRNEVRKQPRVVNIYEIVKNCDCSVSENVYFKNDYPKIGQTGEDLIEIQGLNAIEKVANALLLDMNLEVYLTGSASPTASTTSEYDLDLSKRRVNAVKEKLILLNIDPERINISYFGKDKNRGNIHEFARKVSLEVR